MDEFIQTTHDGILCYRPLLWAPGYRVGDDGTVWSARQPGKNLGTNSQPKLSAMWHQLSMYRRPYGARYVVVCLRPEPCGKVICRYVHRLILEAFVGPAPDGMQVCHNDGDTTNNRLDNLRWDTPVKNCADKIRHGTQPFGEASSLAKRTDADVWEIHRLRLEGMSQKKIAKLVGSCQSDISAILSGKRWRHVKEAFDNQSPEI